MNTKEIAIIAAVGLGAFVLMRKASAGTVYQPGVNPNLTNARPVYYPPGSQLTAAQHAQLMQSQIDAQKYNALYGIGSLFKGMFSGGDSGAVSVSSPGWVPNLTGNVRPSTDYGLGTLYGQPDSVAINLPYNIYTEEISGIGLTSSSDKAALYSDEGYYPYTK